MDEGKFNKRLIIGFEVFLLVLFIFLQFLGYNTNILIIILAAAMVLTLKSSENSFKPKE